MDTTYNVAHDGFTCFAPLKTEDKIKNVVHELAKLEPDTYQRIHTFAGYVETLSEVITDSPVFFVQSSNTRCVAVYWPAVFTGLTSTVHQTYLLRVPCLYDLLELILPALQSVNHAFASLTYRRLQEHKGNDRLNATELAAFRTLKREFLNNPANIVLLNNTLCSLVPYNAVLTPDRTIKRVLDTSYVDSVTVDASGQELNRTAYNTHRALINNVSIIKPQQNVRTNVEDAMFAYVVDDAAMPAIGASPMSLITTFAQSVPADGKLFLSNLGKPIVPKEDLTDMVALHTASNGIVRDYEERIVYVNLNLVNINSLPHTLTALPMFSSMFLSSRDEAAPDRLSVASAPRVATVLTSTPYATHFCTMLDVQDTINIPSAVADWLTLGQKQYIVKVDVPKMYKSLRQAAKVYAPSTEFKPKGTITPMSGKQKALAASLTPPMIPNKVEEGYDIVYTGHKGSVLSFHSIYWKNQAWFRATGKAIGITSLTVAVPRALHDPELPITKGEYRALRPGVMRMQCKNIRQPFYYLNVDTLQDLMLEGERSSAWADYLGEESVFDLLKLFRFVDKESAKRYTQKIQTLVTNCTALNSAAPYYVTAIDTASAGRNNRFTVSGKEYLIYTGERGWVREDIQTLLDYYHPRTKNSEELRVLIDRKSSRNVSRIAMRINEELIAQGMIDADKLLRLQYSRTIDTLIKKYKAEVRKRQRANKKLRDEHTTEVHDVRESAHTA